MAELMERSANREEIQKYSEELSAVEQRIRNFRIGIDGDELALSQLKQIWAAHVLKINILIQGRRLN